MSNATEIQSETGAISMRDDAAEVAVRVGVSSSLVRKVLAGTRKNDKVLKAYRALLKERAKAQRRFQSEKKGA